VAQTKPTISAPLLQEGTGRPTSDAPFPWLQTESSCKNLFVHLGPFLGCGFAFLLPLSLSATYFALIPLIVLWLGAYARVLGAELAGIGKVGAPFLFFIAAYAFSAPFGVDPMRSLRAIPATLFFALTIVVVRQLVRDSGSKRILIALLLGQALAATHSVLAASFPETVTPLFLGAVTESGQLGLVTIILAGLAFSGDRNASREGSALLTWQTFAASALCATLLIAPSIFPAHLKGSLIFWSSLFAGLGFALWHAFLLIKETFFHAEHAASGHALISRQCGRLLLLGILPLLLAALVINLKRGPWMGVFIGGSIFLLGFKPKLLLPLLGAVLAAYFTLAPVRQRIAEIPEHFYITGGRSVMWDIGVELATRYPLGVGLRNSRFLQSFSPDIPASLNHFHNNFINILVEGGWLALACFVWWLINIARTALQRFGPASEPVLAASIGAACLSWQIAGLVEYNWGDSEVRILVYLLLGVLSAITFQRSSQSGTSLTRG
jgi:hypothetical protein